MQGPEFSIEPLPTGSGRGIYRGTMLVADISQIPDTSDAALLSLTRDIYQHCNTLNRREIGRDLLSLSRQLQTITLQSLPELRDALTSQSEAMRGY